MCLYFLEQLGSGHSMSRGDAGGSEGPEDATGEDPRLLFLPFSPPTGSGSRLLRLLLGEAGAGAGVGVVGVPRRPLVAFWRSLPLRVSEGVSGGPLGVPGAATPVRERLPRPLGVRDSMSLVGESQNLPKRDTLSTSVFSTHTNTSITSNIYMPRETRGGKRS